MQPRRLQQHDDRRGLTPAGQATAPLRLALPQPYDFERSTARYRAFGVDLANLWHEGGVHRVVGGREVRIEAAPGGVDVEPLDPETEPVVLHYLGAPFDLAAFYEFAQGDRVLARIVAAQQGLRPPLNPDPFETLVTSISAQQVSLQSAFATRTRLIQRFGAQAGHAWAFPSQTRLAVASVDDVAAVGFSRRKAEYVVGLARADVDWPELATWPDDEIKTVLVSLRGIGEWTADWFLARHLARPRAWPAGDLGLWKALAEHYLEGVRPTVKEARALGSRFAPFENLAAHYLLGSLYGVTAAG